MAIPAGPYPAAIDYADIAPGMDIETTTVWPATGTSSVTRGIVTGADDKQLRYTNSIAAPTAHWALPGATVTYRLMAAPVAAPEPVSDSIVLDDTGAAWQRQGDGSVWQSIHGDMTDWAGFCAAHPTFTLMQNVPIAPLPDPVGPYPVTIAPGDARLGMDLRVTITYDDGGQRVVRGVCPWVQLNPPPDDATPSFLCLPGLSGSELVANSDLVALVAANSSLQSQVDGRYVIAYDPIPDGVTVLVEQMQAWTADSVWEISGIPEPPIGSVVRSKDGVAWQRTGDATADGPGGDLGIWYLAGQGMWSSVAGDHPRSFLWLWGIAAPFIIQQTAA